MQISNIVSPSKTSMACIIASHAPDRSLLPVNKKNQNECNGCVQYTNIKLHASNCFVSNTSYSALFAHLSDLELCRLTRRSNVSAQAYVSIPTTVLVLGSPCKPNAPFASWLITVLGLLRLRLLLSDSWAFLQSFNGRACNGFDSRQSDFESMVQTVAWLNDRRRT